MEILGLFSIPLWAILLLTLVFLYYRYSTRYHDVFKKMGVVGPAPWPVIGNMASTVREGFIESYEAWHKKYGRVFGHFEGMHPLLVVGDADILREITVKEFSNFPNRRNFDIQSVGEPPAAEFLTMLEDDKWRHNRNTLTPTFSGGKLKKMTHLIVEVGKTFVDSLKEKADRREPLDMKQHTGAFTMDAIAATAFGIKLDTRSTPDDPFIKYAKKFFEFSIFSPGLFILLFVPFLSPLIKFFRMEIFPKDSQDFFTSVVNKALAERRANPGKYSDFLQLMINAEKEAQSASDDNDVSHSNETVLESNGDDSHWKDKRKGKGLTDSEILAASITFFGAGYETTASTLAYLFYHLALNPDHQDRLAAEIDQHYPDGKAPDYESIGSLSYLDMVVHESLRINPPVGRMDRMCARDTTVKGLRIPAGVGVALPIYMMHHDAGYWPNPEVFDPERFTPENKEKHHPLQWIPFGYGPRNCIGMRLALFEMKVIIVQLLQKYRFIPNSKTAPLKFKDNPLLSMTKSGVWVTAEHRN